MQISILFFSFIFGALIGSFLNVVIYRFQTGVGYGGRSFCMHCRKQLHAHELVPLFSFLFQKGKCTSCAGPISVQYPLVELTTALACLFFASLMLPVIMITPWFITLGIFLLLTAIFSVMLVITVYDIRHKIIPNKLIYILSGVIVVYRFAMLLFGQSIMLSDILAAVLVPIPFALLWYFSKGRAIGLGDAKLMVPIGLLLGLKQSIVAVMIAFWIGAIVSVIVLVIKHLTKNAQWTMKTEVPFAPFLLLATLLVYFLQIDIATIIGWFTF
ncbi:prepilin peptidase [Candidatus Nomurabacteria bacterium]|nr:prepilin peptidase [Candidatus Nomurabacteria bacterium]